MTRFVIAIEGQAFDGAYGKTVIAPGAMRMSRDRVPVTIGFDHTKLLGEATDFQRDAVTGEISVEVKLDERAAALIGDLGDNWSFAGNTRLGSKAAGVGTGPVVIYEIEPYEVTYLGAKEPQFWKKSYADKPVKPEGDDPRAGREIPPLM